MSWPWSWNCGVQASKPWADLAEIMGRPCGHRMGVRNSFQQGIDGSRFHLINCVIASSAKMTDELNLTHFHPCKFLNPTANLMGVTVSPHSSEEESMMQWVNLIFVCEPLACLQMASMSQVHHSFPGSIKSFVDEALQPWGPQPTFASPAMIHFSPAVLQVVLGEMESSYTIMLHDGLQNLGLRFENLCSSSSTCHFSLSMLHDLLGEMEWSHQIAAKKCFRKHVLGIYLDVRIIVASHAFKVSGV